VNSYWQSVGKEAPLYADKEDAARADDRAGVWAVADGAGGTGIFVGEWAQHLAQCVPVHPFAGLADLSDWLDGHWMPFFDRYRPRAEADPFIGYKFMYEGSGATLATLHQQADQLHWLIYGDAVAVRYRPDTGELLAANSDLRQFESAPYLLNWLDFPKAEGLQSGVWSHQPGQHYALFTDTLGQYVLMAYAALSGDTASLASLAQQPTALGQRAQTHLYYWARQAGTFGELVWKPLRNALPSADTFLAHTQRLRQQQLLGIDDYTCLLIDA
jgi:hypothetical protein